MLKSLAIAAVSILAGCTEAEQAAPSAGPTPLMASVGAKLKTQLADGGFSDADAAEAGEHVLTLLIGPAQRRQKFISRVERQARDRVLVFAAYEWTPDGKFVGYHMEFVQPQGSEVVWLERISAAHYE